MAIREVIEIDQGLCDGCGECVTACAEGAIALVDGKARLVSDVYCDGLGACLGECPQGAISIVRRDAAAFDEHAVAQHLASAKPPAARPGAGGLPVVGAPAGHSGCPGAQTRTWSAAPAAAGPAPAEAPSRLRQWPIQLHLVPAGAPFLRDADLLLAADCVPFAVGGFHDRFLDGHALAIACPKLDGHQEIYVEKLIAMIDEAGIRSIEVVVMEVPCCSGLVRLVQQARSLARRSVAARCRVVGVQGQLLAEQAL